MSQNSHNYDDIIPLPINEEDPQLCRILYTDDYKLTMGLLRALMANKEYSERALDITEKAIDMNAAHYTVWNYRFNIVKNIGKKFEDELDWSESVALNNPKNYQIWSYRQLIIENVESFSPRREYPILQAMLEEDSKNHHVWSYRKWLVEKFGLYNEEELQFTEVFLSNDIRNNSAWSHRFFVSFGDSLVKGSTPSSIAVDREINFAKHAIEKVPTNASSWNYLIGIYNLLKLDYSDLEEFCKRFSDYKVSDDVEPVIESIYALELLAKIYKDSEPKESAKVYSLLAEKYDPIRVNYWNYEKSKLAI